MVIGDLCPEFPRDKGSRSRTGRPNSDKTGIHVRTKREYMCISFVYINWEEQRGRRVRWRKGKRPGAGYFWLVGNTMSI